MDRPIKMESNDDILHYYKQVLYSLSSERYKCKDKNKIEFYDNEINKLSKIINEYNEDSSDK